MRIIFQVFRGFSKKSYPEKAEFEAYKCYWCPRTDSPEHKAYDKRTPGLFKVEWEGQGIIGLC